MRRFLALVCATSLLSGCAATPAPPRFAAAPLPASVPSDLPRNARPLHYTIRIVPEPARLAFAGTSTVELEVYAETSALVLHAADLAITHAVLIGADGTRRTLAATPDPARQTVSFADGAPIAPGAWRLEADYTGRIYTQAQGLFALDYPDRASGEMRRALFTQFEAPDARRFAPMFDEPSYKATFDLAAVIPAGQMAVSNMPVAREVTLADGRREVTFATSPKMSSYLLFFALGDFERASAIAADGTQVGIVAPHGSGASTRYALEGMAPLLPWLADYFGTPYPLPKLDNIAAPGQSQFFGAMENWGAILTFESLLLDDPAITSAAARQRIWGTQAHEVAHQWFGNIVTMAWWDDLWLNEGFASWLASKAVQHFHPEWQDDLSRVAQRERAMALDGFANTHAVVQDIATVSELAQAFDGITYAKGEAVIGMFEAHAGETVWRDGLRRYFANHAWGNTTSADLWAAMAAAGADTLPQIAQDFITQPGVPLVEVAGECVAGETRLALTQSQFSLDRRVETAARPLSWRVPLAIAGGNGTAAERLVLEGSAAMTLPGCTAPVVVNAGQQGYFRTLYAPDLAARNAAGLGSLPVIDQLGLLADAMALAAAGYQPLAPAMALLDGVPGDGHPVLVQEAALYWQEQYQLLPADQPEPRARLAEHVRNRLGPRLAALGYDPVAGEAVVDANLRATLLGVLGEIGDPQVAAQARLRFARLADDPRALDGPLKASWLKLAARGADAAQWEMLARLAAAATGTAERQAYFAALGEARDPALAARALEFALGGAAGTASAEIIANVSAGHPEMALAFVLDHQPQVRALVDASGWQGYVAGLAQGSDDPASIARLEQWRTTLPADEAVPLTRAIDALRLRQATRPARAAALRAWLEAR